MTYSMDSEKRDPARRSLSCLLMNKLKICRWANRLILFSTTLVKHLTKFPMKNSFYNFINTASEETKDFLDNLKQTVVINDINSDEVPISSGVPQGSVPGPILFLAYINDLPEQVKSRVRLFADDTAMYHANSSTTEGQVLQTDLACLEQWEKMWDMQFNPFKCQVLHITRKVKPLNTKYILHNVELESASAANYLEVTISEDRSWSSHIDNTTKKANQTLRFLKRNIRVHHKDLKSVAYETLVRPQLVYASTAWYPHLVKDMNKVEAVQRRAARWTTRDY